MTALMTKFRKKPVVIEAVQFRNGQPWPEGVCDCGEDPMHYGTPHLHNLHTAEGIMDITEGDWIIKGARGELYPCKPEIFAMTYEPA